MGSRRKSLKPFLSDEFAAVIARAYPAFDLPTPPSTGVCEGCCLDAEVEADFLKHPARDLPLHYVQDWYSAACTQQIGFAHIGWILPRVLEFLARGEELASVGEEVVFKRLTLTGYPDQWAPRRVAVMQDFAAALIRHRIAAGEPVDPALCMFGVGGVDIRPLLQILWLLEDDDLARVLWSDLWPYQFRDGIQMNTFWDGPQKIVMRDWYSARELRDRMMNHATKSPSPPQMEAALAIAGAIELSADWTP